MRPMTQHERAARDEIGLMAALRLEMARNTLSQEELLPHCVEVAWRVTRRIAAESARLPGDGHLPPPTSYRWWSTPYVAPLSPTPVEQLLDGTAMQPSGVDDHAFFEVVQWAALSLQIEGTVQRVALDAILLDPVLWPSAADLHHYDDFVLGEAARRLLRRGRYPTAGWLRKNLCLSEHEAHNMTVAAARRHTTLSRIDPDVEKGLMVARLEDYIDRARRGLRPDDEFKGLKQLALVQGLTRNDSLQAVHDQENMVDILARVSGEQQRPALLGGPGGTEGAGTDRAPDMAASEGEAVPEPPHPLS